MIFNTWVFGAFLLAALAVYWSAPARLRPAALAACGLVFYGYAYPPYLALIVLLAAVTFVLGKAIVAARRGRRLALGRWALAASVAASVGLLFFFKYSSLFARTFDSIAGGRVEVGIPNVLVPLAISFFTFEFVHFIVDVYLRKIEDFSLRDFATFAMFFPTLVAGPIKRYQNFAPQIGHVRTMDQLFVAANVYRVLMGLAKKSILADSMNPLVQPLLTPGVPYHAGDYWVAMIAYAAKIYFDFTGYSDIAIGVAGLLGFQILENFDRPYWAPNISLFWRRWHISLSSWIRDYVFVPIGGSRHGRVITLLNLTFVMAIAGLWHGASWHFVLWGLWHGAGLAVHRVWSASAAAGALVARLNTRLCAALSVGATFAFVAFGWILFASPSLAAALVAIKAMFGA